MTITKRHILNEFECALKTYTLNGPRSDSLCYLQKGHGVGSNK